MYNYNIFHHKNVNIQKRLIGGRDYTYQSLLRIFSKYFIIKDGSASVLDLGCGVGTVDFYLANKGFEVVGVDVSSRAINLANKSKNSLDISELSFFCSPIEKIQFKKKFDYIILSEVIEHLSDPAPMIKSIRNFMGVNSLLVVSTPLDTAPLYRWGCLGEFDKKVGHLRRYSREGLLDFLEKGDYEILESFVTEGPLRNLLYTREAFGFILKFIRWPVSIFFNALDRVLAIFFGNSNIYVICRKR